MGPIRRTVAGTVSAYRVANPTAYCVVEFDAQHRAVSLEEKPKSPRSNCALPGLYLYDNNVVDIAAIAVYRPSPGEYEITDVNRVYLEQARLSVEVMSRGTACFGTPARSTQCWTPATTYARPNSAKNSKWEFPRRLRGGRATSLDDDLRERGELLFKYGVTDLDVRKVIDSHHASGSIAMSRAVGSPGSSATAPRSSALQHAI